MDKRQQKTRELIFSSFSKLLKVKNYNNITVKDIIEAANIGRSTFYAHFETKDALLYAMCCDIFDHVFATNSIFCEKADKIFESDANLKIKLAHVLYHVKYNKTDISGILISDSGDIFMKHFKNYLIELFSVHINDFEQRVPRDFLLNYLSSSFAETMKWWMKNKMALPEETLVEYFLKLIPKKGENIFPNV